MRILAISDEVMHGPEGFAGNMLGGIDCVLSCGDLPADCLAFFADCCRGPVLYVHGNHDGPLLEQPPDGCICVEDKIYVHHGVRILGLGGCMRYNSRILQYSQQGMCLMAMKMKLPILANGGFDILLAHAPRGRAWGFGRAGAPRFPRVPAHAGAVPPEGVCAWAYPCTLWGRREGTGFPRDKDHQCLRASCL